MTTHTHLINEDAAERSGRRGADWSGGMITIDVDERVALLTLNRPAKLNAMDASFWPDLRAGIAWAVDQGTRAIVFTGSGNRAFSAGGDIGSFADLVSDHARTAFQHEAMSAFETVRKCPIPTIAAVNGVALGGGCELAMACDFVIAARCATFGLPEARFGLVPGFGVLSAAHCVGEKMANYLIMSGATLSAEEALQCGLVQKLCDDEALVPEALRCAKSVALGSPHAISAAKELIGRPMSAESIALSIERVSTLLGTTESRNAVAQFIGDVGTEGPDR